MILYFSGTGNSRYVAESIQLVTGDDIISINELMKNNNKDTIYANSPLVFIAPTYVARMPRVVSDFIESIHFDGNNKAYFVLTCGSDIGNAAKYIKDICKKKDFDFLGLSSITMPDNHIMIGDVPNEEQANEIIDKAIPHITHIAKSINAGKRLPIETVQLLDKIKSTLINPAFYRLFVKAKHFYTTKSCVGCGKCVKLCPLNNITLVDKQPQWHDTCTHCTHCTACINACPFKAIEYTSKTSRRQRYFNSKHPSKK